ncbi:MAG: hypothetical protein KGQ95_07625 [Acidobacteria bacterium]|nr:hypothetical protein [Acidobacteriota bacterium]
MRRIITAGLASAVLITPAVAMANHAPSKAEQAKIEAVIKAHFKKHYKGEPKGLRVKLSHLDAKYGGFGWSKFIPQAESNGIITWDPPVVPSTSIPPIGMGYIHKYAGKWRVVGHRFAKKGIATGCSKVPAAVRAELEKGLKVKSC